MDDVQKNVSIDAPQDPVRRFGLIVIGDEILSGRRQDKHMSKLIELLNERGLSLSWQSMLQTIPSKLPQP